MPWAVVRGVYKRGIVEPLERAPYREGLEVLVLFPEYVKRTKAEGIWRQIKREIAKEMPDLVSMTENEKREEFDRLSNWSYHFDKVYGGRDIGAPGALYSVGC